MNLWGFTPELFGELERMFPEWLAKNGSLPKSEWYIPFVVDELIRAGRADCRVLPTDSRWFGVTFKEDRPGVVAKFAQLVKDSVYPSPLY